MNDPGDKIDQAVRATSILDALRETDSWFFIGTTGGVVTLIGSEDAKEAILAMVDLVLNTQLKDR